MTDRPRHPALEHGDQPKPAKRKPSKDAMLENGPWMPSPWELADATAIQALMIGKADADQQRRALKYIVEQLAGTYDLSYRPGAEEGRRDTDFAEGRRFVGLQIVKLTRVDLAKMRRSTVDADQAEPKS